MKTLKKLFSVSAIVALLGTLAPMYAFGANYSDELEDAYVYAYAHKITTQGSIDAADMYGDLNRVAMAKMIANYATNVLGLEADTSRNCTFSDVTAALDAEYDNGVTNACQLGLMGIDDNGNVKATFDPKGKVTRAQFATALSRAISQAEDGEALANGNPYYRTHIAYLNGKGIVKSEAEYDVNNLEKRGYVMLMMMRADKDYTPAEGCSVEELLKCIAADDYDACMAACSGDEGGDDNEEPVGNGLATVSGKAAAAQDVPYNAVNVKVGTITLKAGDYDTKVSSVKISRDGLAKFDANTLKVALRGKNVETNYAGVSASTNTATVKFSPAITIKANGSETFDVVVSMAANEEVSNTHNFSVSDVVVSNGTAKGMPVKLGTVKTTSAKSKTVDIEVGNGETPLKAGDTEKVLATVDVTFKADGTLNRFTLVNESATEPTDDVNAAFDNVKAYVDDKVVGSVSLTTNKIVVNNLNITEEKDETVSIELKGDVIYTESQANYLFVMDSIDILEDGKYGMSPSTSSTLGQDADINVQGFDVTYKKTALKNKDIIPGTNNVLVFDSTITTATDMLIKDITVTAAVDGDFEEILKRETAKLIINGEEFMLDNGTDDDLDAIIDGDDIELEDIDVTIDSNRPTKIQIVLSTLKDLTHDHTAKFTVSITNAVSAEDSSVKIIKAADPETVIGDEVSIAGGTLEIVDATEPAPVTRSLFSNQEQEIGRFGVEANNDSFTIKEITLKVDTTASDIAALLDGNLTLVNADDDSSISAKFAAINDDDEIKVTDMNLAVEEDSTLDVKVMANLGSVKDEFTKTVKLTVTSVKVKDSVTTATNAADYEMNQYTFRITAPTITMTRHSDNQFKVVISNSDKDEAVKINNLKARVRTTAENDGYNSTTAVVCLTESADVTDCDNEDNIIVSWPFGTFTGVDLGSPSLIAKTGKKTYYLVVDSEYVEPEVLQANITALDYGTTTADYTESYSIIVK